MGGGEEYQHSPYGRLVGTRIVHVDRDRREIEVEYSAGEQFTNRIGTVAGAVIAGLLDSVTGLVANVGLDEELVAVHKSLAVDYHHPVAPGRLTGRGHVVDRTERDIHSEGELLDATGHRLATGRATLRIIRKPGV